MPKHTKFSVPQDYLERWAKRRRNKVAIDQTDVQPAMATRSARLDTIDRAMDIQQILFEIAQITNNYYGFQVLVVISTAFVVVVFDFYNLLDMIANRHSKSVSKVQDSCGIFWLYGITFCRIPTIVCQRIAYAGLWHRH